MKYPGAISVVHSPVNAQWWVLWHDQILERFATAREAHHFAVQITTPGVSSLLPARKEKARRARSKVEQEYIEVMLDSLLESEEEILRQELPRWAVRA